MTGTFDRPPDKESGRRGGRPDQGLLAQNPTHVGGWRREAYHGWLFAGEYDPLPNAWSEAEYASRHDVRPL